jgi:hypothetical protein
MEDTETPWTLEGMKSSIKFIADPVEKFQLAVLEWLLLIVRVKVKTEVDQGLGRKNRAVTTEESVFVAEFFTPETLSRDFLLLLTAVGMILKDDIVQYRENLDEMHKNIFIHNDLVYIMEEVSLCFKDSFNVPLPVRNSPDWESTLLAEKAAATVLIDVVPVEPRTFISSEEETFVHDNASCFASPIIEKSPNTNEPYANTGVLAQAFAATMAAFAKPGRVNPGSRSTPAADDEELWKTTGQEISVFSKLKSGNLRVAREYRVMWEVMLLKEYYTAAVKSADLLCTESVFLATEPMAPYMQKMFDDAKRENILHDSKARDAENLTPLRFVLGVPCTCCNDLFSLLKVGDAISICTEHSHYDNATGLRVVDKPIKVVFGGTVTMVTDRSHQRKL